MYVFYHSKFIKILESKIQKQSCIVMTQNVKVICHDTGDLALTLTKCPSKYCHQDKCTANAPKYKSHGKSCQGHQFNKVANRSRNMMAYLKATLLLVVGLQLVNGIQANKVR